MTEVFLKGCPLSMMFIVALYLPWCRYLSAQVEVRPQLYADNRQVSVLSDPGLLLHAARLTTQGMLGWLVRNHVRLQLNAVLMSTSR